MKKGKNATKLSRAQIVREVAKNGISIIWNEMKWKLKEVATQRNKKNVEMKYKK